MKAFQTATNVIMIWIIAVFVIRVLSIITLNVKSEEPAYWAALAIAALGMVLLYLRLTRRKPVYRYSSRYRRASQ